MTNDPRKITELTEMTSLAVDDLLTAIDVSESSTGSKNKKLPLSLLDARWLNTNQTFTQSQTGAVARSYAARAGDYVNVKDFGAVADGVTDDTAAFSAMFAAIRATGSSRWLALIPPGKYAINGSINATSIRKASFVHVVANGAELIARSTAKAVLDAANSGRMVIDGLTITAPSSLTKPRCAVQIGRTETGTVAERMTFNHCKFTGFYSLASLYSYASEMLSANRCWFSCIGGPSVIIDGMNYYGITSDHATINVTPNLARSCNNHFFTSCMLGLGGVIANAPFYDFSPPGSGNYALMLVGTPDEVTLDRCYYLGYETSAIKVGIVKVTDQIKQLNISGHCEPDPTALLEFIPLPTTLGGSTVVAQTCQITGFHLSEGVMRSTEALIKNSLSGAVTLHDTKISVAQQGRTDRYVGSYSTAPTQRPGGGSLENNDLWFNSTTQVMMLRSDGAWITATTTPLYLGEFSSDPVETDNNQIRVGAVYVNTANPTKVVREYVTTQVGATLVRQWQNAPTTGGTYFVASKIFSNSRFIVTGEVFVNDYGVTGLDIQRFAGLLAGIDAPTSLALPAAGSYSYMRLSDGSITTYGSQSSVNFGSYTNNGTGTSASRTLYDYDEGTFETVITAATMGNLSVAYSGNNCRYVKIGRMVVAQIYVTFTPTFTTASGNLQFSVPFISESGQRALGIVGDWDPDFTWPTNSQWVNAALLNNTNQLNIIYQVPGQAQNTIDMSEVTSGTEYRVGIQITYRAKD